MTRPTILFDVDKTDHAYAVIADMSGTNRKDIPVRFDIH
jgi:HSP20 family molecular chaperone IbpA